MKRFAILLLSLMLILIAVSGSVSASNNAQTAAEHLYELGLFQGTGTDENGKPNFDLNRTPSRAEAITMLVRLLGKEADAKAGTWDIPFTDVADWAKPYVGYAYANGLTSGTSSTTFGGNDPVTATQYLTLVLRALGYSSSTDFAWDRAWECSDAIGLTNGQYNAQNNTSFLRGDVAIISDSALSVRDKQSVKVDLSGGIPEETGARTLSDSRISAMTNMTVEQAAKEITTLADAYAWLKAANYTTTGMWFESGNIVNYGISPTGEMSWNEAATTIGLLLKDDYDEVGSLIVIVGSSDPGWIYEYFCVPYVKTGGYYYVTDPVDHLTNTGAAPCRFHTVKTSNLALIKDYIVDMQDYCTGVMTVASFPTTTTSFLITEYIPDVSTAVRFRGLDSVTYHFLANADDHAAAQKEKEEREQKELERWQKNAAPLINNYPLPSAIGQRTLSYNDALNLVGADPDTIAERVKTVADALQYMIAARFGYHAPGVYTPWYGFWGFDAPGDEQLTQNYGCCCGGYANAVSYLLQGDYEKVGTLRWVGGGNHTISWVYTDGKYYVFDFTDFSSMGNYNSGIESVVILDRLEDYYDKIPMHIYERNFDLSEIVLMVAFEAGDAMYPSNWNDPPHFTGLTFPKEAEGHVLVIYQKDPNYGVKYEPLNIHIPGWNS